MDLNAAGKTLSKKTKATLNAALKMHEDAVAMHETCAAQTKAAIDMHKTACASIRAMMEDMKDNDGDEASAAEAARVGAQVVNIVA